MKPILLLCMFVAGTMANPVSYGYASPAPAPAAPPAPAPSYAAPAPAAPVSSYYSPAPAAPAAAPAYGSSYGASSEQVTHIPITRYNHEEEHGKSHRISFETGHGINHDEQMQIRPNPNFVGRADDPNFEKNLVTKTGTISYTSPEGQRINLQYTADESGFHATGDHLPVAPTQPAEIVEATRQHQIAFDLAAKAAAEAPEHPVRQEQGGAYGSSYGYAAPPPAAPAAPAPY